MSISRERYALTVDIGGTKTAFGIMDVHGTFIYLEKSPTPIHESNNIREFLISQIHTILGKHKKLAIEGIGIGAGGVVDPESGAIIHATPLLPDWQGTPIKKIIEEEFGVRAAVDNDGNMAALGEYLYGSGKGTHNLVFIAIGTGVGGGAVINGRVLKGGSGSAMNIGHICIERNGRQCNCGKRGCLEAYVSGKAIEKAYQERIEKIPGKNASHPLTPREIFESTAKGDSIAKGVIETALDYLSIGITNIIELFDPDLIVLGGGVSESLGFMLDDLRSRVSSSTGLFIPERILISTLGEKTCLYGAGGAILMGVRL
ncbi:ROK family protein [Candidatus Sumerlaeota bacterium]|nr:ROK family protein [Candidatus Sumerlaeota bacterium]